MEGEAEVCSICHDPLGSELAGQAVQTECGHLFCRTCLLTWLTLHRRCPLCNAEIRRGHRSLREIAPIVGEGLRVQDGQEEEATAMRINLLKRQRSSDEVLAAQFESLAQHLAATITKRRLDSHTTSLPGNMATIAKAGE